LATIGRNNAVADFGWMRLSGRPAWLTRDVAHIYFMIGFRSRLVEALDWLWAYVTFRRGAQIIPAETAGAAVDFPLGATGPEGARAKMVSND
jgi:NADH:quinone reductase (non-electrogenic)